MNKLILGSVLTITAGAIMATALGLSGALSFAADEPHSPLVYKTIEALRERSIAVRSKNIEVPDLTNPKLLAIGAEHYAMMCTGCHLAPGVSEAEDELRPGMYPQPPNLSTHVHTKESTVLVSDQIAAAQRHFWIIKHGVKASGMPAWGLTHSDEVIWGMVAFVQKLPEISAAQYAEMTTQQSNESAHQH